MATSPAPDAAAPPGMCPGIAVLGGGGGGGDGDGSGSGGEDGAGGGGSGSGEEAPDPEKYPECGTASHPVNVVTGRAFTHPIVDVELPGPLVLRLARRYSSKAADRDVGLGFGWTHSLAWEIELGRREAAVWNDNGVCVRFPLPAPGSEVLGPWGWLLQRTTDGMTLDANDGLIRRFTPHPQRPALLLLSEVRDRNHNTIRLDRQGGRLLGIRDSAGRRIAVLAAGDRIGGFRLVGVNATFVNYAYDAAGNLVAATDAAGHTATYAYDEEHRLIRDTDRAGLTFHFRYDDQGRCVESWGDYGDRPDPSLDAEVPARLADGRTIAKGVHHCRFDYSEGYTEVADSVEVRRFFGNRFGLLDKSVIGGKVVTATYDSRGNLTSRTDENGATTRYERDERGRPVRVVDPVGRTTVIERDAGGFPIAFTDGEGQTTRAVRDARGNLVTVTDPLGNSTTWRCDERGLVTQIAFPNGANTRYEYDAEGNLTSVIQANGGAWRYTYDAFGFRLSETDPKGAVTRYGYEPRHLLATLTDSIGQTTSYRYDGEGHRVEEIDPLGRVSRTAWGGYHKMVERVDARGLSVRLRYDREGRLVDVENESGAHHRYRWNAVDLVEELTFDGRRIHYRHDGVGRPIGIRQNTGGWTELAYDASGRLVERKTADGRAVAYAYDGRGELATAATDDTKITLERDAVGRIIRETQTLRGVDHLVEHTYDAVGDRTARRTSLGLDERIRRDLMGFRVGTAIAGDGETRHVRDVIGHEIERVLAKGGRIASEFDALGRLVAREVFGLGGRRAVGPGEPAWIGAGSSSSNARTAWSYNPVDELVLRADATRGPTTYAYDPIGQLLEAKGPQGVERFFYDPARNIHDDRASRDYDGNLLTRRGDVHYRWDAEHNLVEKTSPAGRWVYRHDGLGRLVAAEASDGTRVELAYDALNRRLEKRVSRSVDGAPPRLVSTVRYVWDGNELVHAIRSTDDATVEERTFVFIDGSQEPIAQGIFTTADGGARRWTHFCNDPAGTPERLVGEDGSIVSEASRAAWGALERPFDSPFASPGQMPDEETGLVYNRHRYYDPETARFVSADPIGLAGGLNEFAFVPNPLTWIDPFGLAKRGPKPKDPVTGRGGPHNDTIMDRIAAIKEEHPDWEHTHGGTKTEEVIDTPGGKKSCRRPDITFTRKDGSKYRENVGKQEPGGPPVTPIKREREAMDDIEAATGQRPNFTPYATQGKTKKP